MVDIRLARDNEVIAAHPQVVCTRRPRHGDGTNRASATVIREADETDASLLAEILRKSFADVAERFGLTVENCPKSVAFHTDERVESDFERGMRFYILEYRGVPCGCVALERPEPEFCYLGRLAVLPEYRGKGLGKALATRAFYEAWELGAQRVEIGMIAKDTKLARWYAKLGFVPNGTKQFEGFPFVVGFMVKKV